MTELIVELIESDKANALDVFVYAWLAIPNGTPHSVCVNRVFEALDANGYKIMKVRQ